VLHESRLSRRLIRTPGIIVWHDFTNAAVEVRTRSRVCTTTAGRSTASKVLLAFMRVEKSDADLTAQG
jgi:hypothetical protein